MSLRAGGDIDGTIRSLWRRGHPAWEIAVEVGVSRTTVYRRAKAMGLPSTGRKPGQARGGVRRRIDPEQLPKLIGMGLTTREIAERLGVQPPSVVQACHARGLPLPGTGADIPAPEPAAQAARDMGTVAPEGMCGVDAAIMRSAGSYEVLAAIAGKHGMSLAEAQRRWHRLRVSA